MTENEVNKTTEERVETEVTQPKAQGSDAGKTDADAAKEDSEEEESPQASPATEKTN